ncbi:hypothetical protein Tco_1138512, partial [Tanacetum coccineum]
DSPFELEAFSESDYRGASLDRKSTTGGCQFLGRRLISWKCKKETIVANSTTKAEYVAAANCCGQVLWIQNQMMDYSFNFMNTKIHIDNESTISVIKNPVARTKHIEIRFHFIRDCYEKRLIKVIKIHTDHNVADLFTKGFDVTRFNFLVVSIRLLNFYLGSKESLERNMDGTEEFLLSTLFDFWLTKVSTKATVSTDKQDEGTDKRNEGTDKQDGDTDNTKVSTDRQVEGTADQNKGKSATPTVTSTPTLTTSTPTISTPTVFGDDEIIAQVLIIMSQTKEKLKEKEKGVKLKDVEEIERPRPTSTRSLLNLRALPKIDTKAILQEINLGPNDDIFEAYEKVIKEMNKQAADAFKKIVKKDDSVEGEIKEEEGTRKRMLGIRKKMKSKKRKFTYKDDKELRLCLTIAPDEVKEVDYEIL